MLLTSKSNGRRTQNCIIKTEHVHFVSILRNHITKYMYYADWIFNFFSIQIFPFLSVINWIGQNGTIIEMVVCWRLLHTTINSGTNWATATGVYIHIVHYMWLAGVRLSILEWWIGISNQLWAKDNYGFPSDQQLLMQTLSLVEKSKKKLWKFRGLNVTKHTR